jgi:hypothetical protein
VKHNYRIDNSENNRLKEAKLFKSLVSWNYLEDLDNSGILTHLAKHGQLTHDVFYKLMNDIVHEEADRANRKLDLTHVTVEIKSKYNYEEFIKHYGQQNSN